MSSTNKRKDVSLRWISGDPFHWQDNKFLFSIELEPELFSYEYFVATPYRSLSIRIDPWSGSQSGRSRVLPGTHHLVPDRVEGKRIEFLFSQSERRKKGMV